MLLAVLQTTVFVCLLGYHVTFAEKMRFRYNAILQSNARHLEEKISLYSQVIEQENRTLEYLTYVKTSGKAATLETKDLVELQKLLGPSPSEPIKAEMQHILQNEILHLQSSLRCAEETTDNSCVSTYL